MSPIIKRKGDRFQLPSKYLLLILTMICVCLMVLTFMTDFVGGPLNNIVGAVVVPFQEGVSEVGTWLSDRSEELGQLKDVLKENQDLMLELNELKIENTQLQQDKYELNNLRELYKMDAQYSEYKKVGARIIARDTGNWFYSFLINKGKDDGILIDMNVIAEGGLVGRVSKVGNTWSKVTSIIDDNSNVSGMILATADNLIVSGDLELMVDGLIRFEQLVDSKERVSVGDKIVTSNISDKYLPGILIGYVSKINIDSNNLSKSGYVTPAVDFEHLEEVLIITERKHSIE
ncbi:MAG TPA: rod shape-determining protein MreC [Lachnospiraceae bacterium]|nr:rod shape-determining protein MreC [Lachnospiraceae bacterium]